MGTVTLDPGAAHSWAREVHWHRLLGVVEATGPVEVLVEGPSGRPETVAQGASLRLDHLVACCRSGAWTPHTLTIANPGDHRVEVRLDLVLLHDNLAVTVDDAEPGAWWQTLAIVGLMIGIPAWRARQPPPGEPPAPWLRRSRVLHARAWALGGLLALVGSIRFGSGPLAGTLGATAWAPLDMAGVVNTHTLVMLWLMALWGGAVACWAAGRRRAGRPGAYPLDGILLASGSPVVGGLMLLELGGSWIPLVLGLLPAAGLVADALLGGSARGPDPVPTG